MLLSWRCSTPYGVIAVITTTGMIDNAGKRKCSTPYGVIAVITQRRSGHNGTGLHRAQRRMASLRSSPYPRQSSISLVRRAQRRMASLRSSHREDPSNSRVIIRAQRRMASLRSSHPVGLGTRLRQSSGAQRRMASLRSSLKRMLSPHKPDARAQRRMASLRSSLDVDRTSVLTLCSTPYGVIAVITTLPSGQRLQISGCSTPYGVIAVITRSDWYVVTQGVLNAVWRHCGHHCALAYVRGTRGLVLNAVWRHCGHHSLTRAVTRIESRCSTPYGVIAVITWTQWRVRHRCSTPYGVIAVITS